MCFDAIYHKMSIMLLNGPGLAESVWEHMRHTYLAFTCLTVVQIAQMVNLQVQRANF